MRTSTFSSRSLVGLALVALALGACSVDDSTPSHRVSPAAEREPAPVEEETPESEPAEEAEEIILEEEEPTPAEPEDALPEIDTWIDASDREFIAELRDSGVGVYVPLTSDEAYVFEVGTFPEPAREDIEAVPVDAEIGMFAYEFDDGYSHERIFANAGLVAITVGRPPSVIDGAIVELGGYSVYPVGLGHVDTWPEGTPVSGANGEAANITDCNTAMSRAQAIKEFLEQHADYPSEVPVISHSC